LYVREGSNGHLHCRLNLRNPSWITYVRIHPDFEAEQALRANYVEFIAEVPKSLLGLTS
jgi:hypothetical protein